MKRRGFFAMLGAAVAAPLLPKAAMASGGVVPAGKAYLVGERGPETIMPASRINSADGACWLDFDKGMLTITVGCGGAGGVGGGNSS